MEFYQIERLKQQKIADLYQQWGKALFKGLHYKRPLLVNLLECEHVDFRQIQVLPTYIPPGQHYVVIQNEGFRTSQVHKVFAPHRDEEIPLLEKPAALKSRCRQFLKPYSVFSKWTEDSLDIIE